MKHRDSDYYEYLDYAKRDLHDELEVVYILSNMSRIDKFDKILEVLNTQILIDFSKPGEFKIEPYPEADQLFLYLPMRSIFSHSTKLKNLGFTLYHMKGVGYAN